MAEDQETLERLIKALKEPVEIDPALDQRVMAAITQQPRTVKSKGWLARRWTIRLSPLGALAAAAVFAALIVSGSLFFRPAATISTAATATSTERSGEVTQFVLVAPSARTVALVGDFNDWSTSATQLVRKAGDGVWWVTIPLPPGRYRYAFVVDGTGWRPDPNAPGAEDEFGGRISVVTIGGA